MKDEVAQWQKYADENYKSAELLLGQQLFNTCLQNIQQCVEKSLKSLVIEHLLSFRKTHDILELKNLLLANSLIIDLTDDECEFLNSIYLPSKYPLGSVLADFEPDYEICKEALGIAEKVIRSVKGILND